MSNPFADLICTICFEDLEPNIEDLLSISICGHVFHELCIQQWFEYCRNGKNCPVCKQTCSDKDVNRLYFQSAGDHNDRCLTQRLQNFEARQEELLGEVKGLEGKLSSALEQQKNLKEINAELKKEAAMKDDAIIAKATAEQLFHLKCESLLMSYARAREYEQELERSNLKCMRLQERSIALANELAAVKLVSDLNLDEEEVIKLASLGKEPNSKEMVDVLKRSLVIRNRSYKELMAKCHPLGRGDLCFVRELEKAKEKLQKLKTRIQELETAIEAKDNEDLRALKGPKESKSVTDVPAGVYYNFASYSSVDVLRRITRRNVLMHAFTTD